MKKYLGIEAVIVSGLSRELAIAYGFIAALHTVIFMALSYLPRFNVFAVAFCLLFPFAHSIYQMIFYIKLYRNLRKIGK